MWVLIRMKSMKVESFVVVFVVWCMMVKLNWFGLLLSLCFMVVRIMEFSVFMVLFLVGVVRLMKMVLSMRKISSSGGIMMKVVCWVMFDMR